MTNYDTTLRDYYLARFGRAVERCAHADEVAAAGAVFAHVIRNLPPNTPQNVAEVLERAWAVVIAETTVQAALSHEGGTFENPQTSPPLGERTDAELDAIFGRILAEVTEHLTGES
ncbi:MAG: hypothetical protein KDB37_11175 [Ilumatobacter sp.]|nr:hypothetical protein [Ilumatobacter sp.]